MIDTPSDNGMPADIEKKYNAAKNAVTMAEAEVARLRDLRIAEEVTIVELNKQHKYLAERIAESDSVLNESKNALETAQKTLESVRAEIESLRQEKVDTLKALESREHLCDQKAAELAKSEEELNVREEQIRSREETLETRENDVTSRENKLRTFVAGI